jgi:hypothetical protein
MTFALAALALLGQTQAPIQLFNGTNLDGWTMDVPALDANPSGPKPFVVRGKNLVTLGAPGGHLVSNQIFQNYRLIAEYRFTGKPGNCGILVHASAPRSLYSMFPKSIEVQLQSGDAGDFWCIGENIEVPDMVARRGPEETWGVDGDKARRIKNLTDGSEHPLGQWNTIVIDCRGNAIKVWVNGDLVNSGTNATASSGKIAIQSEGTEVEFRRVEVQPYPIR